MPRATRTAPARMCSRVGAGQADRFHRQQELVGQARRNISDFTYTPIKADATRVAALLSGDVDMVTDLPTQDVDRLRRNDKLKVIAGHEVRTIFIGLDQHNDELLFSSVKGRNPFKDARVRRALNMAVDREAIKRVTMRGLSIPAGLMVAPACTGTPRSSTSPGVRRERREETARRGRLPQRFRVHARLPEQPLCERRGDLPGAGRHVGARRPQREAQRHAVRDFHPQDPEARHQRLYARLGVATFDALYTLQSLVRTQTTGADGSFKLRTREHPRLDAMIDAIKITTDLRKRDALLREALVATRDNAYYGPAAPPVAALGHEEERLDGAPRRRPAGSALHEGGLILRLAWLRLWEHDLAWRFRRSPVAVAAALVTLACVGAALAAPWIAPQDPFNPAALDLNQAFRPPAWLDGGSAGYFLGSDDQGREPAVGHSAWRAHLARRRAGGGMLRALPGRLARLAAGYSGGWLDALVMRIADVQLSFRRS